MAENSNRLKAQTYPKAADGLRGGDLFEDSDSDASSEQHSPVGASDQQWLSSSAPNDKEELKESIASIPRKEHAIPAVAASTQIDSQVLEKMQKLEAQITEYRNKLGQIERILKEEDDVKDDPDKKEEVEKLRD